MCQLYCEIYISKDISFISGRDSLGTCSTEMLLVMIYCFSRLRMKMLRKCWSIWKDMTTNLCISFIWSTFSKLMPSMDNNLV